MIGDIIQFDGLSDIWEREQLYTLETFRIGRFGCREWEMQRLKIDHIKTKEVHPSRTFVGRRRRRWRSCIVFRGRWSRVLGAGRSVG